MPVTTNKPQVTHKRTREAAELHHMPCSPAKTTRLEVPNNPMTGPTKQVPDQNTNITETGTKKKNPPIPSDRTTTTARNRGNSLISKRKQTPSQQQPKSTGQMSIRKFLNPQTRTNRHDPGPKEAPSNSNSKNNDNLVVERETEGGEGSTVMLTEGDLSKAYKHHLGGGQVDQQM